MPENFTQIKDKVEMIDNNLSFDLQLTFQDVMNDLTCSNQQIARRFKLLIQQKQNLLRKQINQINSNNIKILHQKTLFFQNVNSVNKNLNQQLIIKDTQISSLKHQIQNLQSQLSQLHNKLSLQQQKFQNFETHTLQDYKRLQIIQKKYQNLLNEIQEQKNRKNQLQRRVNKLNSNTINWGDRIKYLLINRQKGLKVQYEQQIAKLKDILFFYENDNKSLKDQLEKEKKNSNLCKQNHNYVLNSFQKKYGIQKVPSYQNIEVQTFQNSIKKFDVGVQTHAECKQCAKINNLARHFLNKNVQIQTDEDPRRFIDSETQTIFNFLSKDDELKLIAKVKEIIKISQKQQNIYQAKIKELQKILEIQPSKMEDLKEIRRLQKLLSQKDKIIEQIQNQCASLKGLNNILHSQVQNLKLQTKQEKQVRIDSLQFKKKNNTLRMFTEQYPTFVNLQVPDDQMFGRTLTFQKNFSKTVDMNTTLLNFKTKRSRTSVFTPEKRTKTPKQKLTQSFIGLDQESSHWKTIEKKLKNPQLFSPSPHVNAVRREKYKKFSLMKRKQSNEKQPCINFTIAF